MYLFLKGNLFKKDEDKNKQTNSLSKMKTDYRA
jgi:hypothetical protein